MSRTVRKRSKRGKRNANAQPAGISQLPHRALRNRFPPIEPLDPEQVEFIHDVSLRIVEEQGIEVAGDLALALFREAGADVSDSGLVRMAPELLLDTVSTAPSQFTLASRNPDNSISCGGDALLFGLVSGPPNVHDCLNGRRAGNIEDYKKLVKLGQYFNAVSFFGNQIIAPTDLPANTRHLDTSYCNLTLSDKVFFASAIGAGRAKDAVEMAAIARGLSLQQLATSPSVLTNININSPRKLDDAMAYGAMQMAMLGQAVAVTPFTLMGAMTPATMAGALAQQNAEALVGIALVQLTRPGAPVVYGGFTSNVDMRSGSPAFGTPENAIANLAGGQFARKYNLPYRTSACNASNVVDGQAVWETQMSLWSAVMGHGNFIYHAAGWLEGGLVASFEKVVMDCEMMQHISAFLQPLRIDLNEVGLEAMQEVGPGGHFFGCDHTMQRFRDAFYQPFLSDWQNYENWQAAGEKTATQRATEIWQHALRDYEEPVIDPATREAMQAFMARRKEELGSAEPKLEPEPL